MVDTLALILVVINTALLVIVFLRLQTSASKKDIVNVMHWVRMGRAKALVESAEQIKKGYTKRDVEALLGEADSPNDKEWVYYLDEHCGYIVAFDSTSRVESVNAWRS
ncbi:outer membrane protein assembly factor BamE [candidate division KSB1 bacterium]|nr:outer membrane protein assembly factor BamE [candidate division KSB1 bacterium]